MRNLKEILKNIDENKEFEIKVHQEAYPIFADENQNIYIDIEGEKIKLSQSHIMQASLYDINFKLEPSNFTREFKKKFAISETKRKIEKLYDHQLATLGSFGSSILKGKSSSYNAILNRNERVLLENKIGALSEIMVESFLNKFFYDNDLPVKLEGANVTQDVGDGVDFILKYQSSLGKLEQGIQFTIAESKNRLSEKRKKIENQRDLGNIDYLNDLVLVQIPMGKETKEAFVSWLNSSEKDKITKLPDDYLSKDLKEVIIYKFLSALPDSVKKEIDLILQKNNFNNKNMQENNLEKIQIEKEDLTLERLKNLNTLETEVKAGFLPALNQINQDKEINLKPRENGFHLTIIGPSENKVLKNLSEEQFIELQKINESIQKGKGVTIEGLGFIDGSQEENTRDTDKNKKVVFIAVSIPELQEFRRSVGLAEKDFHVTLGFENGDIHMEVVGKNEKGKLILKPISKKSNLEMAKYLDLINQESLKFEQLDGQAKQQKKKR